MARAAGVEVVLNCYWQPAAGVDRRSMALAPELSALLGVDAIPMPTRRARPPLVVASLVARSVAHALTRDALGPTPASALGAVDDWCVAQTDVPAGGSWAAGSRLDALRLAMHYALCDVVVVGASTVAAEGAAELARPWFWEAATPAALPELSGEGRLAAALEATRRAWQQQGWLSSRPVPALVVMSAGRDPEARWLSAPALARRRDGSPAESWILTSEDGASRLAPMLRRRGSPVRLLPCSAPGRSDVIDVGRAPALLGETLGAKIVGHDGGPAALAAWLRADAVDQLHITLRGGAPLGAKPAAAQRLSLLPADETLSASAPPFALLCSPIEDCWIAHVDGHTARLASID